ncbi:MAG TPA: glycoside hydrolase domain-containing protein, partial [Thermoguttaceae bacterium]|nr:glycoside hydrolase domain-containing protein [Thermoguttaceae bacterium]
MSRHGQRCVIPKRFVDSLAWPLLLLTIVSWSTSTSVSAEPAPASEASKQAAAPDWLGSRAGISDEVLPPWTPVEVSGTEVSVWGRTYGLRDLPLPASVVTRDTEILASPIVLTGESGGKKLVWTGLGLETAEAKPAIARLAARADSESLRCEGTVSVEYDGMMRCDFKLVPKQGGVSLDKLVLEIPLRPEYAKYLHFWPGRWGSCFNSTALPEDGYQGAFKPFVWLGDEWRGLAWFSESDRNFFPARSDRVIEIRREGEAVVLRVNIVTEPQTLRDPLDYTFGFQATPVKPAKPDVWDYRICHMGRYGMEDAQLDRLRELGVRTICFHEQWTDVQAYPKTTHGEKLKKLVDACHQRDIRLLLYHGYEMSTIAPEWNEYHERCLVHPRRGGYKRKYQPEPDQTAYIVCYRSVWQDFIAHHLQKLIDEHGVDGVYLDGTSEPWGCANQKHGCGYVRPDGSVGQTFPFFDTRSMMKRIYTLVKAHDPGGQVNVHQSTCMTIPTLAFATSYWDGEQLQSVARKDAAQEVLPIDAFCCEFMGHNWGVPGELLHYKSGPFQRFECVSLALLHDVLVRPSSMEDVEVSSRMWKAMDAFGRDEATWLPYWENADFVSTSPPQVKVSIYNRPEQGLIAVVANMGRDDCEAEVTFN